MPTFAEFSHRPRVRAQNLYLLPRNTLLLSLLILLTAAYRNVGYHQGDEHFQILEFAGYKADITPEDALAWEYEEQMRPALQPFIAYVTYRAAGIFGPPNPNIIAGFLRFLSAGFFLAVALLFYRRYHPFFGGKVGKYFVWLLLFHWCAVYVGVRFSSENWSGLLVALGLLVYPFSGEHELAPVSRKPTNGLAFLSGLCFGLGFLCRYQVALMAVGFGAWLLFIGRARGGRVISLVGGGLAALLIGSILSYWLYGEWLSPAWHYFEQNLVAGKAATYGTLPWWGYFYLVFSRGIPPLSLIYIAGFLVFCYAYRRHPVTWMAVPFFLVHCYLSRKDVRFLFPLLPFLPLMLAGVGRWVKRRAGTNFFLRLWPRRITLGLFVINFVLLAGVALRAVRSKSALNAWIYRNYEEPTTIFYTDKNPFIYYKLREHFYERPGKYRHVKVDELTDIDCQTDHCLVVDRRRGAAAPMPEGLFLVRQTVPDLLVGANLPTWRVYKLSK